MTSLTDYRDHCRQMATDLFGEVAEEPTVATADAGGTDERTRM